MTKRTILIILGALLLLVIIALAWWWFLTWSAAQPGPQEGFGSAGERTEQGVGGDQTNIRTDLNESAGAGQNTGTNINLGRAGSRGSSGGSGGSSRSGTSRGTSGTAGVTWLPTGGTLSSFDPTQANQLNDGTLGGEVVIFGTPPQPKTGTDLSTALIVAGIGTALCTAGLLPGVVAATGAAGAAVGSPGVPSADVGVRLQNVISIGHMTNETIRENFLNCVTRTIARAALQQITASTVNWINSGFNGKPSFVQNYQQFFTNVADQAAGAYIQGSALSFLCSPFGNKIKIALAQSYANRNAQSCTLSRVSKNIQGFMNGNFSAGGWSGLLQFTTVPTNNPFGAYSYAQSGLANAQSQAAQNAQRRISPGGFLATEEKYDCRPTPGPTLDGKPLPPTCKTRITTPGSTIETTLAETLNVDKRLLTQAGVSGSFDAIINALMQQLTLKALQGGLSNLSGLNGYEGDFLTPDQRQAQSQGNALLAALQQISNNAGQYGAVAQGSIGDIQNTQLRLQDLANCYEAKGQGAQASAAIAARDAYEQRIAFYNERITRANAAIALLQGFQTRVLQVTSSAQVAAIQTDLDAAQASGALILITEVTIATQARATLQSDLNSRNQQTQSEIQQCRASS